MVIINQELEVIRASIECVILTQKNVIKVFFSKKTTLEQMEKFSKFFQMYLRHPKNDAYFFKSHLWYLKKDFGKNQLTLTIPQELLKGKVIDLKNPPIPQPGDLIVFRIFNQKVEEFELQ
jgi:hypothetical protein